MPPWRRLAFDRSFLFVVAFATASAVLCWLLRGREAVFESLEADGLLLLKIAPAVLGAVLLSNILVALVPSSVIKNWLGENSGWRGLAVATAVGAMVPGGPMISFPIVLSLFSAGAEIGVMTAFITSWAVLALHRMILWELPLMGSEFAVVRVASSLALPFVAGWSMRWLAARFGMPRVGPKP